MAQLCKMQRSEEKNAQGKFTFTCSECGAVRLGKMPRYIRQCDAKPKEVKKKKKKQGKTQQYLKARRKWVAAGKPVRSAEEVAEIFAICQSNECGKFEPAKIFSKTKGGCKECGCNLAQQTGRLFNKIEWATEHCPLGYWGEKKE